MIPLRTGGFQWSIVPVRKQLFVGAAEVQRLVNQEELDPSIRQSGKQLCCQRGQILADPLDPSLQFGQDRPAVVVVDWLAVVGIDKAKVPEFGALVQVGHPRTSELQEQLS